MQCDEKKQICLNYVTNVPEWQTALTLENLAAFGAAVRALGNLEKSIAGDLAWEKMNPDDPYLGTEPIDRVHACNEAAYAMGEALFALEMILAQSSQFGSAKNLASAAESAYSTKHAILEDRCRRHGCQEVAYHHG